MEAKTYLETRSCSGQALGIILACPSSLIPASKLYANDVCFVFNVYPESNHIPLPLQNIEAAAWSLAFGDSLGKTWLYSSYLQWNLWTSERKDGTLVEAMSPTVLFFSGQHTLLLCDATNPMNSVKPALWWDHGPSASKLSCFHGGFDCVSVCGKDSHFCLRMLSKLELPQPLGGWRGWSHIAPGGAALLVCAVVSPLSKKGKAVTPWVTYIFVTSGNTLGYRVQVNDV